MLRHILVALPLVALGGSVQSQPQSFDVIVRNGPGDQVFRLAAGEGRGGVQEMGLAFVNLGARPRS